MVVANAYVPLVAGIGKSWWPCAGERRSNCHEEILCDTILQHLGKDKKE